MGVERILNVMGVVQVSVEMDDVQRGEFRQTAHHWEGDGVVASHHCWQRAAFDGLLHRAGNAAEIAHNLRRNDGDIPAVRYDHAAQELVPGINVEEALGGSLPSVRVRVGIGPRRVPKRVRSETRSRPSQRSLVKRHTDEGDIGFQLLNVLAQGRVEKRPRLRPQIGPRLLWLARRRRKGGHQYHLQKLSAT